MTYSKIAFISVILLLLSACSSMGKLQGKPHTPDNVCSIFAQFESWQTSANASEKQWSIDQSISMAFIEHESGFNATARPPRKRVFGVIPGAHLSSAYGYPQAINGTWSLYKQLTGYSHAQRTNFNDSIDFVGWYNSRSVRLNKIDPNDAYHLYLAYHEGNGGFAKKSYLAKPWLLNVAQDVSHQAQRYRSQLEFCSPQS
ncbi:MAG: transglycosylase SLT domain-containing protein [Gammaproteobacteria bacterium]|nr:transglycosylase SLT domain-containing protein [Gammaproteobacteria bacterium]